MNETIVTTLIAAMAAGVPAYLIARRTPSRSVQERASNADAAGDISASATGISGAAAQLVALAAGEVQRLHRDVEAARLEARDARVHANACERRVSKLEEALRSQGIDPAGIVAL